MTARGATSWGHMSHDVAEVGIDPGEMTGPGRPSYLKTEAKHSISFQGSENKLFTENNHQYQNTMAPQPKSLSAPHPSTLRSSNERAASGHVEPTLEGSVSL